MPSMLNGRIDAHEDEILGLKGRLATLWKTVASLSEHHKATKDDLSSLRRVLIQIYVQYLRGSGNRG